ncbi:MAG: amidase [Propionibacteriaceae bacterium]|jgi:amidase|nr:amidase [Propionibacteriaceae bacterium]
MMIHELGAEALAGAIRAGDVSVVEVTEHTLRRAEEIGPGVGAFAHLCADRALEQARKLDALFGSGQEVPPLFGVPCPIKDLNAVAGVPMECGSAVMAGNVATFDDGVVTWLAQAGTVMVGKTNTPEFGFPCYTEPDNAPPARTPWDLTRSAGGSSGGAAAAVAAKIVPIAQASDGGGSIRIPASSCGLVGLKPSRGRISPAPHVFPGPGLTTNGVLTRDVRDTAIGLDVLAGARAGDIFYAPVPQTSFRAACDTPPGRLRIGMLATPVIAWADVHPACVQAVDKAAVALEGLGHIIEDAPVPMSVDDWDAFAALWSVGAATLPIPLGKESLLRPLTKWLREKGNGYSGKAYAWAMTAAQRVAQRIATAWDRYDIILTPTLAQPPARIGALRDDLDPAADFAAQTRFTPWTSIYNVSGAPAISLPLHTAWVDGVELPIGVMLGARFGAEATLLSVSAQLQDNGFLGR